MRESSTPIAELLSLLENVLRDNPLPVPLHEPFLGSEECKAVAQCVESGWVSYLGPEVDALERALEERFNGGHVIATVSGTAALHLALILAGVLPGDEVLMPALTFAATANAVKFAEAAPHFVDIDPQTLGVCPKRLDDYLASSTQKRSGQRRNKFTGRRIAALVAVHIFGHPAQTDELAEVCKKYELALVEDAAESFGSLRNGIPTGRTGITAAFSFNGNKIITAGGGGAVLCANPEIAAMGRHLATTAKVSHPWKLAHDRIGFNYRMPNLNAALALVQLNRIDEFLVRKRALAKQYATAFEGFSNANFLFEPPGTRSNYWLNTIIMQDAILPLRNKLFQKIRSAGFLIRPAWELLTTLPHFAECPCADLSTSKDMQPRIVNLPSSATLASL